MTDETPTRQYCYLCENWVRLDDWDIHYLVLHAGMNPSSRRGAL